MSEKNFIFLMTLIVVVIVVLVFPPTFKPWPSNSSQVATPTPTGCTAAETFTNLGPALKAKLQVCALSMVGMSAKSIPLSLLSSFPNLKILNLSHNQLTSLPAGFATTLTGLTYLNLSYNNFATTTPDLGAMTDLTDLNISNNQLADLPATLNGLTNLSQLNISSNKFTQLPAVVSGMKNLVELDLQNNPIVALPSGTVSGLPKLSFLDIAGTNLAPTVVTQLKASLPKVDVITK